MKFSHDKQVTRMARAGVEAVFMYGRWWALERGQFYRVKYNRQNPAQSSIVRVLLPS